MKKAPKGSKKINEVNRVEMDVLTHDELKEFREFQKAGKSKAAAAAKVAKELKSFDAKKLKKGDKIMFSPIKDSEEKLGEVDTVDGAWIWLRDLDANLVDTSDHEKPRYVGEVGTKERRIETSSFYAVLISNVHRRA